MVRTFTHKEPSSFETLRSQFFCTRRCVKLGPQSPSSIEFWSDPKFEFSGTESLNPDPRESQIWLLGGAHCKNHTVSIPNNYQHGWGIFKLGRDVHVSKLCMKTLEIIGLVHALKAELVHKWLVYLVCHDLAQYWYVTWFSFSANKISIDPLGFS